MLHVKSVVYFPKRSIFFYNFLASTEIKFDVLVSYILEHIYRKTKEAKILDKIYKEEYYCKYFKKSNFKLPLLETK